MANICFISGYKTTTLNRSKYLILNKIVTSYDILVCKGLFYQRRLVRLSLSDDRSASIAAHCFSLFQVSLFSQERLSLGQPASVPRGALLLGQMGTQSVASIRRKSTCFLLLIVPNEPNVNFGPSSKQEIYFNYQFPGIF